MKNSDRNSSTIIKKYFNEYMTIHVARTLNFVGLIG